MPLTIREVYKWAKDNEIEDLRSLIDYLIFRKEVGWEDDESKLWTHDMTFGGLGGGKMKCVCRPVKDESDEIIDEESELPEQTIHSLEGQSTRRKITPAMERHITKFKNAARICKERAKHLTGEKRVRTYLECMREELKK